MQATRFSAQTVNIAPLSLHGNLSIFPSTRLMSKRELGIVANWNFDFAFSRNGPSCF